MRTIAYLITMGMAGCLAVGCSSETESLSAPLNGQVEVHPVLPGLLEASPKNDAVFRATDVLTEAETGTTDIFFGKNAQHLPDGSTLWLYVEETTDGESTDKKTYLKSYVVRDIDDKRQALYPCTVTHDADGNVESVTETSVPLYLTVGKQYTFRAMSPARQLVTTKAGDYAVNIRNKEYLMANDDRYTSTGFTTTKITNDNNVEYITLKPLAHQTAQLEFTISKAEDDKDIFSLDVMPQGVEVSGVQSHYEKESETNGWNWCWTGTPQTHLVAKVGDSNERFTIRKNNRQQENFIINKSNTELYVKCPILPTDAYSGSIIVLFNLSVNGIPTQYEMMLNQKVFKSAYSYHYKGEVKMEEGIVTITWQYVSWNEELPIL